MSPRWIVLLSLASVVALAAPAVAQTEARPVTLAEVLESASENPRAVLAALSKLEQTRAEQELARGAYLPRLGAGITGGIQYDNRPVLPGPPVVRFDSSTLTSSMSLNAEWTAFDLSRGHAVNAGGSSVQAQEHAAAATRRTAMQGAAELYFGALAAAALVDDAALSLERRAHQLEAIRALVKAGVRPGVDEARATIDAVAATHAVEIRKVDQLALEAALASASGGDPTLPLRPVPKDESLEKPASLEDALKVALERRPELAARLATLEARRAEDRAARGQRWPTAGVTVTGQAAYNDIVSGVGISGHIYGGTAALYLRWNALDPTVWRKAWVTSAAIGEAERNVEAELLAIRAEVTDAFFSVRRTQAALEQATKVLEAAQVARTAQRERYTRGMASLLELLDAEAVEQGARQRRIEAVRDYQVAQVKLLGACGTLGR